MRDRPQRARVVLPVVAAALVVGLACSAVFADARLATGRNGWGESVVLLLLAATITGTGLLICLRSDAPRIGWLLIALAAALPDYDRFLVPHVDGVSDEAPTWARTLLSLYTANWIVMFAVITTLAIVFPTGRPATRRWRLVLQLSLAGWIVLLAGHLLLNRPNQAPYEDVSGPLAFAPDWLAGGAQVVGLAAVAISVLAAPVALIQRYRGARGVERLQVKWLAAALVLLPVTFAVCLVASLATGSFSETAVSIPFIALVIGVTAAVGIAITRYHLYEIDVILNRALVYGALTIVLATSWVGVALLVGTLVGGDSGLAAAAATAGAALVFLPLRRALQDVVDRRLARARYAAVNRIRALEDAVREGRAHPEEIEGVLREALGDPGARLLVRLPSGSELVALDGTPAGDDRAPVSSSISRNGQEIGMLVHDAELLDRPDLLRSTLEAASLTIELARLQVDLRRRLEEVEASRERIVRAGYEERRRLERDLHDGAQQRLVGLGIRLRRLQRSLPREAQVLAPAFDEAVNEVGLTITDLRTIASGVRPARLDDGLAAALDDLARASPVPVTVTADLERLPGEVEAAAYYVACEAVTNAVKHGAPRSISVEAVRGAGGLRVVVADDGVGGASARAGGGLAGLADRVEAHGGTLQLLSLPGQGTRVEAEIPCGS